MIGGGEVQGSGPVSLMETFPDGFCCLHLEPLFEHMIVEYFEVQDGSPLPWRRLGSNEKMIVISWALNILNQFYYSVF